MSNPQNQTLEEIAKLEQELNSLLEAARKMANACKEKYEYDWEGYKEFGSARQDKVEWFLSKAQKCAEKLGRDIKATVDEIIQIAYAGAAQHHIIWAEACSSINPHNARMHLIGAKNFAQKAKIDIASQIQKLEATLEPKQPKTELIQESEIPIEGVTIISFGEYRTLGGQMSQAQYEQVKRVRTTQDLCQQALRESHEVGGAYVDASQMELLARIIAIVPNMSSFDRVCEMFLLQGKKTNPNSPPFFSS